MKPQNYKLVRAGFTLIELLTVIAIIGILAAIIIPTVGKVRESAKTAQCTSNLRQVSNSFQLYANDNKGYLPKPFNNPVAPGQPWHDEIVPYLPRRDSASWNQGHNAVMQCPGIKWNGVTPSEAGAGYSMCGASVGVAGTASASGNLRKLNSIKTPSVSPWLADGAQAGASGSGMYYASYYITRSQITTDVTNNTNLKGDFRHGTRMNFAFADNSVRGINRGDFVAKFPTDARFNGLE